MTGEITLRGKVLPVGGIKEKILAAKRANIKEIILSEKNRKDIEDINPKYLKGLKFHYVKEMNRGGKPCVTQAKGGQSFESRIIFAILFGCSFQMLHEHFGL